MTDKQPPGEGRVAAPAKGAGVVRLAEGESHFHVGGLPCDDCGSGLGVYVHAGGNQMRWVRCGSCGSTNEKESTDAR